MPSPIAPELPPLNCGGCRKCCLGDKIMLLPGDDPSQFKTVAEGGRLVLQRGFDGNCVYLGATGCSIYGAQPKMCQAMDCRRYARDVQRLPFAERAKRLLNPLVGPVIQEGLDRLSA